MKIDEFQKLSIYPSRPEFIFTFGNGISGIGRSKVEIKFETT